MLIIYWKSIERLVSLEVRTNQIETKVTRIIDGKPVVFTVYADADNIYEAIAAQTAAILSKITETNKLPAFGCVEVYDKDIYETLRGVLNDSV